MQRRVQSISRSIQKATGFAMDLQHMHYLLLQVDIAAAGLG